jgi:hypothetical protein
VGSTPSHRHHRSGRRPSTSSTSTTGLHDLPGAIAHDLGEGQQNFLKNVQDPKLRPLVAVGVLAFGAGVALFGAASASALGLGAACTQAGAAGTRIAAGLTLFAAGFTFWSTYKTPDREADDTDTFHPKDFRNNPACPTPSPWPSPSPGPTVVGPLLPYYKNAPVVCGGP